MVAPTLASALSLGGVIAIALVSAWAIRRSRNRDVHWAILAAAMLLMSPLGWMYYIPLLIPTFAAVIPSRRHVSARSVIAAAILWVPSSVLARNTFGPLATATIASPYTWGLLLLWAAVCLDSSIGLAANLRNNRRRRITLFDRRPDDLPAARFDDVATDDGVFGPVGAFDEHIWLDR